MEPDRAKYRNELFAFRASWPACFRRCGLLPSSHDAFPHLQLADVRLSEDEGSGDGGDGDFAQAVEEVCEGGCDVSDGVREGGGDVSDGSSSGSETLRLDKRIRRAEWFVDGRVVVYTDGACRNNQHRRLRRAGFGCFWGLGHARNIAEPLAREIQTN